MVQFDSKPRLEAIIKLIFCLENGEYIPPRMSISVRNFLPCGKCVEKTLENDLIV